MNAVPKARRQVRPRPACAGCAFAFVLWGLFLSPAFAEAPADPDRPTQNLFGMTGTIDTPSAEMQPEGEISVTSGFFSGFLRNTATTQIFPGVEVAFRYSVIDDFFATGETTLYDRSFDIKLQLVDEGPTWPGLAVGLQDFLGTGVYSGEYLVATKNFLDGDLTVSGGVGWGRFAGTNPIPNPLGVLSDNFETRNDGADTGGTVTFGNFFRGEDIGLFAGVEWATPLDGLVLKAEYSDDDYDRERVLNDFDPGIPFNFGAEYRLTDWLDLGAYWMYGSEFGFRVTISGNVYDPPAAEDTARAPLPFSPRAEAESIAAQEQLGRIEERINTRAPDISFKSAPVSNVVVENRLGSVRWATADLAPGIEDCPADAATAIDAEFGVVDAVSFRNTAGAIVCTVALRPEGQAAIRLIQRPIGAYATDWYADEGARVAVIDALRETLLEDGIELFAVELTAERVSVYIENKTYLSMPRSFGRTARALSRTMPPSVELFEVIPMEASLPVAAITLQRTSLEERVNRPDGARDVWLTSRLSDAPPLPYDTDKLALIDDNFPRVYWAIEPGLPVNLFDPDQPARFDLVAIASGGIELLPGFSLNASIQQRLIGDLDNISRESNSTLPRVRSDIAEYLREGEPALTRLTADYITKLDDAVYARVSAGLLERMYAGVSTEVLWKPAGQSWGVGGEINFVRQRGFDTLFTFRDFNQITGHASVYWDSPFYDLSFQVDAGRYLAGDYGSTLTVSRKFSNGWEIGGFATFTNVPFDEFGEGSFDKGLFFSIPLNWAVPYETRSRFTSVVRPLTRDGGQRLDISNRLYPIVEDQDRGRYREDWGDFWK